MPDRVQEVGFRLPSHLVLALDRWVDRVGCRSREQLLRMLIVPAIQEATFHVD